MTQRVTLDEARSLLGQDLFGPEEVGAAFGSLDSASAELPIPYDRTEIEAAKKNGEMLVLRLPQGADGKPITINAMIERFPKAFDEGLLRKAGYQLKSEWGIELEPLAEKDTCSGWALVRKQILEDTRNLAYEEQSARLQDYAGARSLGIDGVRRRTAVEAVFDTVVVFAARGEHLLENTWDWTSSETVDGGYLNVGGFGTKGMQILSFSAAVRHGALGICPTRGPKT